MKELPVGYTYQAENVCPDCVLQPEDIGHVWSVDGVLDVMARFMDIDRNDEETFDSGTFPKVIMDFQVTDEDRCDKCNRKLLW